LDNPLAEDVVLLYSGTDASYYQLELCTELLDKPISRETVRILRVPSSSKTFNTANSPGAVFLKDIQYGFLVFDSPYISWSTPNFFFELAASDPFLDPERLISGLFYDPDDFVFVEIVHGTTLLLHVHCSHIAQK
jgi:hypothetical protein